MSRWLGAEGHFAIEKAASAEARGTCIGEHYPRAGSAASGKETKGCWLRDYSCRKVPLLDPWPASGAKPLLDLVHSFPPETLGHFLIPSLLSGETEKLRAADG